MFSRVFLYFDRQNKQPRGVGKASITVTTTRAIGLSGQRNWDRNEVYANMKNIDFELICDNFNSTIFLSDKNGVVVYVNKAYLKQTGLKEEQLIGKTIQELQRNNVFQCDIIPQILKDGRPRSAIGYVPEHDYRGFISGIPILDELGSLRYVMTTDWDVNSISKIQSYLDCLRTDEGGLDLSCVLGNQKEQQNALAACETMFFVSKEMREVVDLMLIVASTDVPVLITGETGTGKEVMATALVSCSNRKTKPYIRINCAATPNDLIESELFGYIPGAFTGASSTGKKGAFEVANGGTILLDEIGELPYHAQAKLLRVLQEGEITKVGDSIPIPVDVRVIAATNRDLQNEIKEGRFREDLYYRLNVVQLKIPPLRERREDIAHIAVKFLSEFRKKYNREVNIDNEILEVLSLYEWPGNIRQLRNTMERLVITSISGLITREDVNKLIEFDNEKEAKNSLKDIVSQFEQGVIKSAIAECGSKAKAADKLQVERTTFIKKCQKYGI